MSLKYYKEDDILVIKTSEEPFDYAEMMDNFVVHFTKDDKPVRIEILDASKFFSRASKFLTRKDKRSELVKA